MSTLLSRNLERQFHFRECLFEFVGGRSANHGIAIIAHNAHNRRPIATNNTVQAPTAFRIAEAGSAGEWSA